MAEVSERTLQVAVVVSFAAGFVAGWQANRMRRKFLDWRKKRLQDKLCGLSYIITGLLFVNLWILDVLHVCLNLKMTSLCSAPPIFSCHTC
ncbi:hypothetical protein NQZ68_005308 [Dissostichus eleginoides]|nr:hypothetical protein NQZ68_005308 [Dissostichus eleginoides]